MTDIQKLIESLRAQARTDRARKAALDFVLNEAADALERSDGDSVLRVEWRVADASEYREWRLSALGTSETMTLQGGHGSITVSVGNALRRSAEPTK